ncbi:MAG: alginate lyase family protein [Armatimonadetes bacterium]|nr:alginate lyase family protein [Armatimonadota bacterium]
MRQIAMPVQFGVMAAALAYHTAWGYEARLGPKKAYEKIDLGALKFPERHPLAFYTPAEIEQIKQIIATGDESLPQVRHYRAFTANAEKWVEEEVTIDPEGGAYRNLPGGLCAKESTALMHKRLPNGTWLRYAAEPEPVSLSPEQVRLPDGAWLHVCPTCGTVYQGEVFDSYARGVENLHFAQRIQALGLAYAFTGDERCARRARQILLGFAETYPGMSTPVNYEDLRLNYWSEYMVSGYDLVCDSPAFSAQDRDAIEKNIFRPVAENRTRAADREGRNNRGAHAISQAAAIGFLLRDREMVDYCLNNPQSGFAYLMANCVDDDGLWSERMGYHWYTMRGLLNFTEPAYRAGINLYVHSRYRAMLTGPMQLLFPEGGLDNKGSRIPVVHYAIAQLRAPDPRFERVVASADLHSLPVDVRTLWLIPDWKMGAPEAPETLPSKNFTGWGYAILRSGQAPRQTFLSISWLDHAIYLGHAPAPKFGVIYHGGGRLWTPFGSSAYTTPQCGGWFRKPVGNNALTVDGQKQQVSFGRTVAFQAGPRLQIVEAEEDQAYAGVTQKRALMLADGYAVDVCRATSDEEHRYDLALRCFGELSTKMGLQPRPGPLGWRAGLEYVDDVRSARTSETWSADWRQDAEHALRLTMLGGPATEVLVGSAPGRSPDDRAPFVLRRRSGKEASFVSLLEAYGSDPAITAVERLSPREAEETVVKVSRPEATDYLLVSAGSGVCCHQDLQLDGDFGIVSLNQSGPEAHYAQLVNGRRLSGGGWTLTATLPGTLYLECAADGEYLLATGSDTSGMVTLRARRADGVRVETGGGGPAVGATVAPGAVSFEAAAGQTYRIAGLSALTEAALAADPRPAAESVPVATVAAEPPAATVPPIQGKNRVRNSGFEVTPTEGDPWLVENSYIEKWLQPKFSRDDTVAHTGKRSLRLPAVTWFSPITCDMWLHQRNVVASPGASTWTLSAYVRADKPTKVRLALYGEEPGWGENDEGGVSPTFEIGTEWQRISVTRQFRPGITSVGVVVKREHQAFGGDVWVDDVQLEEGAAATEYAPDSWTQARG